MSEADQYHDDHDDDQDQDQRVHGRGVPGPVDLETEVVALRAERDAWERTAMFHAEWAEDAEARAEAAEAERDDLRARIDAALAIGVMLEDEEEAIDNAWCAGWNAARLGFRAALRGGSALDPQPHRGAEIDCCEDDPDTWFAVCPTCGWQSPPSESRHAAATALAHHQTNPVAALSASPQPPNPDPAPCATCGGTGTSCYVEDSPVGPIGRYLPCPSCSASPAKPCD